MKAPSESKNGNKLQFSVGFQVNAVTDLKLEKEVTGGEVDAETPVFTTPLTDVTEATSATLDGTATVSDGGTISYQWYKNEVAIENETSATITVTESGAYKVVATNTNTSATGSTTATAESSCNVTIG